MPALPKHARFLPHAHVAFRETAAGGVLVDLTTGKYFELNAVGALIWARLAAGDTVGDMVAAVNARYDVGAGTAEMDVDRWCSEVVSAGLVDHRNESP